MLSMNQIGQSPPLACLQNSQPHWEFNQWQIGRVRPRVMACLLLRRQAPHADYPFGFLEVTLNEKGEGSGKMLTAAKLKFNEKKGHWEIDPHGTGYTKVTNVAPNK